MHHYIVTFLQQWLFKCCISLHFQLRIRLSIWKHYEWQINTLHLATVANTFSLATGAIFTFFVTELIYFFSSVAFLACDCWEILVPNQIIRLHFCKQLTAKELSILFFLLQKSSTLLFCLHNYSPFKSYSLSCNSRICAKQSSKTFVKNSVNL